MSQPPPPPFYALLAQWLATQYTLQAHQMQQQQMQLQVQIEHVCGGAGGGEGGLNRSATPPAEQQQWGAAVADGMCLSPGDRVVVVHPGHFNATDKITIPLRKIAQQFGVEIVAQQVKLVDGINAARKSSPNSRSRLYTVRGHTNQGDATDSLLQLLNSKAAPGDRVAYEITDALLRDASTLRYLSTGRRRNNVLVSESAEGAVAKVLQLPWAPASVVFLHHSAFNCDSNSKRKHNESEGTSDDDSSSTSSSPSSDVVSVTPPPPTELTLPSSVFSGDLPDASTPILGGAEDDAQSQDATGRAPKRQRVADLHSPAPASMQSMHQSPPLSAFVATGIMDPSPLSPLTDSGLSLPLLLAQEDEHNIALGNSNRSHHDLLSPFLSQPEVLSSPFSFAAGGVSWP